MPEICRFYGIVIRLYFDDHPPPPRALGLVIEWVSLRQGELLVCWEKASRGGNPGRVAPLD